MKKKYYILILFISCLCYIITPTRIAKGNSNSEQEDFINLIKYEAIEGYKQYNILPSLTIAQAILESSWGKSSLTEDGNNLFGIKAFDDWNGNTINIPTKEFFNNNYVYVTAKFKAYDSYSDSIKDHNKLISTERYEEVRNSTNYLEACNAIYNCGYATSPTYSETLINIIECFNLYEYDNPDYMNSILSVKKILLTNTNEWNIKECPIIKTASKMDFVPKSIFKYEYEEITSPNDSIEDTNNIPKDIDKNTLYNDKYWYVIYCLLQNYY